MSSESSNVVRRLRVFLSYSHADGKRLKRLRQNLANLREEALIEDWHDRAIVAGQEWETEIATKLNQAHVIVLLLSPDFLNSHFCCKVEMTRAIERHKAKEALVIPVVLRHIEGLPKEIRFIQSIPADLKPQDRGYVAAAQAIRQAIENFQPIAVTPIGDDGAPANSQSATDSANDSELDGWRTETIGCFLQLFRSLRVTVVSRLLPKFWSFHPTCRTKILNVGWNS